MIYFEPSLEVYLFIGIPLWGRCISRSGQELFGMYLCFNVSVCTSLYMTIINAGVVLIICIFFYYFFKEGVIDFINLLILKTTIG